MYSILLSSLPFFSLTLPLFYTYTFLHPKTEASSSLSSLFLFFILNFSTPLFSLRFAFLRLILLPTSHFSLLTCPPLSLFPNVIYDLVVYSLTSKKFTCFSSRTQISLFWQTASFNQIRVDSLVDDGHWPFSWLRKVINLKNSTGRKTSFEKVICFFKLQKKSNCDFYIWLYVQIIRKHLYTNLFRPIIKSLYLVYSLYYTF